MPTLNEYEAIKSAVLNQQVAQDITPQSPFSDQSINNCVLNDVAGYDLADRVGLPGDNLKITIDDVDGMTYLKLDDTDNTYKGKAGKFPMVKDGEDGLEFSDGGGESLWKTRGRHIYNKNYRDGCVGMGTNDPNEDYKAHVEGDFLTRAAASGSEVWSDVVGRD